MKLLDSVGCDPKGKSVVVVGRSNLVGKPIALMLLARHATVTLCHSRTVDLKGEVSRADILIVASGKATDAEHRLAKIHRERIRPFHRCGVGIQRSDKSITILVMIDEFHGGYDATPIGHAPDLPTPNGKAE